MAQSVGRCLYGVLRLPTLNFNHKEDKLTTTATKTRKDGLQKVAEAEAAWVAAKDADHAAGSEHSKLLRRYQELNDERQRLIYKNPELTDHLGAPVGPDNPVGKLDQEREALPDLTESAAKAEHTRNITRSKRQGFEAIAANNAEAMKEEQYAKDEALRSDYASTMAKAAELRQATRGYPAPVDGDRSHLPRGPPAGLPSTRWRIRSAPFGG